MDSSARCCCAEAWSRVGERALIEVLGDPIDQVDQIIHGIDAVLAAVEVVHGLLQPGLHVSGLGVRLYGLVRLAALAIGGSLGLFLMPAQAAPLGEYFPVPNGFNLNGVAKDALLNTEATWLQDGLDNLAKAKKETEASLEKAKGGAQDQAAALVGVARRRAGPVSGRVQFGRAPQVI